MLEPRRDRARRAARRRQPDDGAAAFLLKGDVVGRRFRIANMKDEPPYSPASAGAADWIEIVGVVADARNDGLRNPVRPAFYVPFTLKMRMFTPLLVRTRVPPLSMLRDIRARRRPHGAVGHLLNVAADLRAA
jgi:hypothetical protein